MTKKTDITDEEKSLFREAIRGTKPLINTKILSNPAKKPPVRLKNKQTEPLPEASYIFSDYETLEPVSSETLLNYARSGLQHKVLRNFRTGQYNIEATLDLHGMTALQAKDTLSEFLTYCLEQKIKYTLIIHGKGRGNNKPVLKNRLNHWLRQTEDVQAFCSAITKDGSSGALYVLLRRK